MNIAYSPCPNDTYIFDAWINGKIPTAIKPTAILADVQQLNAWAYQGIYPVTKLSCFTFGKVTDKYHLLPSGAAISTTGPKIIAKEPFNIKDLANMRILVPGLDTTAYLLLRILCPDAKEIGVARYDEIPSKLEANEADCGLIIHETRSSVERLGFVTICDLGELFTKNFGYACPLGMVVAKKEAYREAARALRESIQYALDNPDSSFDYIRRHSQEKDKQTIQQHIETYVTPDTVQITENGMKAIQTLFQLGVELKLLPKESLKFYETDHFCYL